MLLRSKFFSCVLDIHDEDRIAQSFNIFVDCELAELNQMIQIASMPIKKIKPVDAPLKRNKTIMKSPPRR